MKNKKEVGKLSTSNDKQVKINGKKTMWFVSNKIVDSEGNYEESLLTTTYVYDVDEQYDCIVSPSTTIDEDESEDTTWMRTR